MLGRVAYEDPWVLADVDRVFYKTPNVGYSRREILEIYAEYGQHVLEEFPKTACPTLIKPIISLFLGEKHSKHYRQYLSDAQNVKKHKKNFRELIYGAIECFSALNPEAIDQKPPTGDEVKEQKET